jgi:hypothetical protein
MAADALRDALAPLRRQWRESPVIRIGALAVVAILGWYVQANLTDYNERLAGQAANQAERLARLERLQDATEWRERAEAATDRLATLQDRLWRAPTRGIGQAQFQSWLERARAQSGLGAMDQSLGNSDPVAALDGVVQIRARLQGGFNRTSLFDFLERVEGHAQHVDVEALSIRGERLEITLSAYVRVTGSGEEAASNG